MPDRERPLSLTGGRERRPGRAGGSRNGGGYRPRDPRQRGYQRRPPQRQTYWRRRVAAISVLVIALIAVWFLYSLLQPFHGSGSGEVTVTIPHDANTDEISSILTKDDVVSSGFFFKLRVKLSGDGSKFHAGRFIMMHGMSYSSALSVLTSKPAAPATTSVTIDSGHSRVQAQAVLHAAGIGGNYVALTRKSALLDPATYGAPRNTPSLEGFLWPARYELRVPVSMKALIADQLTTFKQQFKTVNFSYAKAHGLSEYDVLIIASLITEEAMKTSDYPKAAAVIYNRLRLGMDLGLDSTVSYATGNYGTLTEKDLRSSSPWNTTNHRGLPPTPIDSPGMTEIEAAAHPAKSDALYFINRVCGNGALNFTASYATFLRWSAEWNTAVAKATKSHGSAEFCGKRGKP